jgi:hypothetical protein
LRHSILIIVFSAATIALCHVASAQQGGCVFGETALLYADAEGDEIAFTAHKGDCVAGVDGFKREGERIHVRYFLTKKRMRTAWMVPSDLTFFDYECTCSNDDNSGCSSLLVHFGWWEWNDCYKAGRDRLLAEGPHPQGNGSDGVKPLTNDDVIKLTKAGLGDDIVATKVASAPAVEFDTSVDALIRLKQEGVGKAVIEAMVKEPSRAPSSPRTAATTLRSVSASDVQVTSNADAVKGCKSRGLIHAKVDAYFGKGPELATKRLKVLAAAQGANVVLLIGGFTSRDDGSSLKVMGDGEAYECPGK